MKGVIVQVGEPKSIVLFNNGKIFAIPTPAEAHVGMVVTVKLNSRAKILAVSLAIVLALGIGIGIFMVRGSRSEKKHGQYQNPQEIERMEQKEHDTSGYSFQKGKEENK